MIEAPSSLHEMKVEIVKELARGRAVDGAHQKPLGRKVQALAEIPKIGRGILGIKGEQ